jgi:hypothetical protein
MAPVKISLVTVGHMPPDFTRDRLRSWGSSLFEIVGKSESYALSRDSDGPEWQYSDQAMEEVLPTQFDGDFLFAIANVPLTCNYYGRRLSGNRAVVSLHEVAAIMRAANIPIENAVLRLLYSAALVYRRFDNRIPRTGENDTFTHDETRGCLFDMNGFKTDLVASCHKPSICPDCVVRLKSEKVPLETIDAVQRELKGIRKGLYFRLVDWVRAHPIFALLISAFAAIVLGAIGSLIASYLYAAITSAPSVH